MATSSFLVGGWLVSEAQGIVSGPERRGQSETVRFDPCAVLTRLKADHDCEQSRANEQAVVESDRARADEVLQGERASADDRLRREREDYGHALAELLPLEREHTDRDLGLYISKSLIEAHKGRIWIDGKVGQGSVFHFTVPVAAGA